MVAIRKFWNCFIIIINNAIIIIIIIIVKRKGVCIEYERFEEATEQHKDWRVPDALVIEYHIH